MTTIPLERNTVIDIYQKGELLKFINDNRSEKDKLIAMLIELHNEGKINIIETFKQLNPSDKKISFFRTRHFLESILSELNAPILPVMECVNYLFQSVKEDLAAGAIIDSFTKFCAVNVERTQKALKHIIENNSFIDLLPAVLVAGAQQDIEFYLNQAIQFTEHESIEIRKQAVFGLGKIDYSKNPNLMEKTINCLMLSINRESDDILLAYAINSCFFLFQQDNSKITEVLTLIDLALPKGKDYTLYRSAYLLSAYYESIPLKLLNSFLSALLNVEPKKEEILTQISFALRLLLLYSDKQNNAVEFLELFLVKKQNSLPRNFLQEIGKILSSNKQLLNRLTTKWFLIGERILCERIGEAFTHQDTFSVSVELSEIDITNPNHLIFLARKAIGYLLLKNPIIATNFIISLIQHAQDDKTKQELGVLLFNPLLLNYTGKVRNHLIDVSKQQKEESVIKIVNNALENIDKYLLDLKSIVNIPELHPSQEQCEIYQRYRNHILQKAQKEAYKNSLAALICSEQTILYGRKTSNYIKGLDGKFYHTEIEPQPHFFEFEQARFVNLSPLELDYMLFIFRNERLKNETNY